MAVLKKLAVILILGIASSSGEEANPKNTTIVPAIVKRKVCEICDCTVEIVDCSGRKLDNNLHDSEWPSYAIKVVNFENNNITRVKPFPNITINRLSLANNTIEKIDDHAFKQLTNLTELDLSHNLLTYENLMPNALKGRFVPEAYEPLDKLKLLNLSGNKLHSLNRDIFEHVGDLKILILSNNPFSVFDLSSTIAISSIPYLKELYLSHCQLKNLEEVTFHSLRYLKKLDLSYNEFLKIPDALLHLKSLEVLNLDGNPIEFLGLHNSLPVLPHLKELSISNMPILMIIEKNALSNLEALEILKIINCTKLSEISDLALAKQKEKSSTTWPPLKMLNLSDNALRYLPSTLVARWDRLEELHLMNNPWSCDCDNQYLIGTLLPELNTKLMANESANLICAFPPEHQNKSLLSLKNHKLRCLDIYDARPERDAAVLVGMLIGVLLAVPVVLIFFIFWRRGFIFCGPQGPASYSRAFYKRAPPYNDDI